MPVYGAESRKKPGGVTLVSTRHRLPAIPIAPLHLLGKGRLLEPKSRSGQDVHLRAGIEKETEGVTLVSTRHSPRQFPLPPYTWAIEPGTVGPQWELRPLLALADQRFVFALPLGARTSAHSGPACRVSRRPLQATGDLDERPRQASWLFQLGSPADHDREWDISLQGSLLEKESMAIRSDIVVVRRRVGGEEDRG